MPSSFRESLSLAGIDRLQKPVSHVDSIPNGRGQSANRPASVRDEVDCAHSKVNRRKPRAAHEVVLHTQVASKLKIGNSHAEMHRS
jgi:hypothetical protein